MTDQNCIFCKIALGEVSCHKIWEDEKHMAFLSIYPNTPGFTVVITKNHYPSYAFENSDEVLLGLVLASKKVARLLDHAFADVARSGMFFEGFGINHLHSKLFPMHGTANLEKWTPIKSQLKTFFDTYPGFMSSHDGERAPDEELARLAQMIREKVSKS